MSIAAIRIAHRVANFFDEQGCDNIEVETNDVTELRYTTPNGHLGSLTISKDGTMTERMGMDNGQPLEVIGTYRNMQQLRAAWM